MPTEELLAIAEIAVALIGFSSLFSAFTARPASEFEARDLSALAMIISTGASALVFALVPVALAQFALPEPAVWRASSWVFGGALVAGAVVFALVNRRLRVQGHAERTPGLNRVANVAFGVGGVLMLATGAGALGPGRGPYVAVLVGCIFLCLVFVGFLLVVTRRS